MSELDERVARLEYEMAEVRYLARRADRDVSDYRAVLHGHTAVLSSLRETQLEHGARLDGLERRMEEGFAAANENFARIDREFATVRHGLATITGLLTDKIDDAES